MSTNYGNLKANGAHWEISNLPPHVAIRFKHLFPKVPKNSAGPFRLPMDDITCADLSWFTSRYPLSCSAADSAALFQGASAFEKKHADLERILLPDYKPDKSYKVRRGQKVRPYQAQAIELLRIRKRLLLGDEGGLGKSYVAAAFAASTPEALPAAVVCDPHMQTQWSDKIAEFTTLKTHIIKKGSPYNLPRADVYIFRVSQIAKWIDFFGTKFFKSVIFDEPQSLRTGIETAKGAAAFELQKHAEFVIGLTATPIYNYGVEMWNVLRFVDETVLGDYADFSREWVDHNGHIKDPKALGSYLREQKVLLRRLKADVGLQLPKVSRPVRYVESDGKAVESIEALARQLAIKATTGSFIERGQASRDLDLMVRQATGIGKARAVAQFVKLLVASGEPVLLFGWHRAVYDIWLEELAELRPAMYTGSETHTKKCAEKARFMSGDTDVMIMSLRSTAGVDDLQHRCSVIVIGELDWSPGVHQQIIWRVDRDGQKNPVMAFFLVCNDGSDPAMMDINGIKASEATMIVDPDLGIQRIDTDESGLRKLIEQYLRKADAQAQSEPA